MKTRKEKIPYGGKGWFTLYIWDSTLIFLLCSSIAVYCAICSFVSILHPEGNLFSGIFCGILASFMLWRGVSIFKKAILLLWDVREGKQVGFFHLNTCIGVGNLYFFGKKKYVDLCFIEEPLQKDVRLFEEDSPDFPIMEDMLYKVTYYPRSKIVTDGGGNCPSVTATERTVCARGKQ